ncbi:MAG: sorbosone dehydrogenase family protein [Candidatus Eisenbacteria bacterium]|nr:sorbosone dehydrogenase family protein [Candidatus Latescibacterota bacterium]MBD3301465.1 sorbosone dehydrogenase family protein [Candidatus Eisenbacteria bacterium]
MERRVPVTLRRAELREIPIALSVLFLMLAGCSRTTQGGGTDLEAIRLPDGFRIGPFAALPGARSMALAPDGTVFVGTRDVGSVYAVRDADEDGRAERSWTIAEGLRSPNGVAFRDGSLFVAEIGRILRYDDILAHLDDPPEPTVVTDVYPEDPHHGWKFIAFGPDGLLYVPVGAPCNVCDPENPIYASITRIDPAAPEPEIFAEGVRNTVGFDWDPETGALWFTDNGRDWLGDDRPPDELNRAPTSGLHFGYPYCHGDSISDPELGRDRDCADYVAPVQELGPHVAALGMRFYTGTTFPSAYQNQIFIAEHGSWNRSEKIGYRVMLVRLDENREPISYEPFAEGWLQGEQAWGRPVDVQVMPDGALLVSDDRAGRIYRISYGD